MELLSHYLSSLKSKESTIPLIISRERIYEILESFTGTMPESLEQIQTGDFSQVFFYGIAEEKKHFDIATVRKCIQDMSLRPYEGKNLYILMDVDTATLEAQNALLKILEECPEYAIIVLAVSNPE
jgi:DNA polymerase III gamma/tau subunit